MTGDAIQSLYEVCTIRRLLSIALFLSSPHFSLTHILHRFRRLHTISRALSSTTLNALPVIQPQHVVNSCAISPLTSLPINRTYTYTHLKKHHTPTLTSKTPHIYTNLLKTPHRHAYVHTTKTSRTRTYALQRHIHAHTYALQRHTRTIDTFMLTLLSSLCV